MTSTFLRWDTEVRLNLYAERTFIFVAVGSPKIIENV